MNLNELKRLKPEELMKLYEDSYQAVSASLQNTNEEELRKPWSFRRGQTVIFSLPKVASIRTLGISHMIHHRGQLSVYLRLLDIPVPGMYGPSADEMM